MNSSKNIRSIAERCISAAKELSSEPMFGQPTDIIGFSALGQELAALLEDIVGFKEICYYDATPVSTKYHYLEFKNMLSRSEYMFITCPATPESLALFDNLPNLNKNCKIIIAASGFEETAAKFAKIVGAGNIRIVEP